MKTIMTCIDKMCNIQYKNGLVTKHLKYSKHHKRKQACPIIAILFLLGVAVMMDLKTYKVKNGLVLLLFLTSLVLRCIQDGFTGVGKGIVQMLLSFLILLPIYAFHALGAADIKILLSLSVLFPLQGMIYIFISSIFIGLIFSLLKCFYKNPKSFRWILSYFSPFKDKSEYHHIHFTIPIFISVILYGGVL